MNVLEVDSVILDFGDRRVLQHVYLQTQTGKITGLLGRNGSGKSCLLKIIFGELQSNDQSVRINQTTLITNARSEKDMKYLPQFPFIPKSLRLQRIFNDYKVDFEDFVNLFPDFEMHRNVRIGNLSSGERRIVEIYSLVTSETKFCLLDEPFSQVMPIHIEGIKQLIVRESLHKGIIITDHLYKHIVDICQDLYIIDNGQTYLSKSPDDLKKYNYIR